MLSSLIESDQWLFGLINQTWQNTFFDFLLPIWREKKTWIPLYIVLVLFVLYDRGFKSFWVFIIIGTTMFFSDYISSELIKKTVERLRPCNDTSLSNVRLLLEHCGGGYSFTSSHASNHFALAMQIFLLFRLDWNKIYFVLFFLWAAIISYSQVYVGVHYPLDIFFGAVLGSLVALAVYKLAGWLGITRKIWS